MADQMERANRKAFLMIRNGGNVHAVYSGIKYMHRLFPTSDEFEKPFVGYQGDTITPRDLRYPKSKSEADALALYYRRVLVLLAGLNDRGTKVLGGFPGGYVNLLRLESQSRVFKFVFDDEKTLADGRPAFADWVKYHNDRIDSGDTIACYWPMLLSYGNAPGCWSRHWNDEHRVRYFEPEEAVGYRRAYRQKDRHYVKVEVSGRSWSARYWEDDREFTAKVMLPEPTGAKGWWIDDFTYLRIKEVESADIDYYIDNREARKHYLKLIPGLVKIQRLLLERKEEEPP